ncbi:unnamed protein product [Microthlaspi erraticum]|uniref:Uncharacterized protein n=1 Tax=Microthlaspi erraticum TaxID=1685480 RepID=A0A6D2I4E6_9BRAS|nr:unnamed protein product [Microthlaspi erraticum]
MALQEEGSDETESEEEGEEVNQLVEESEQDQKFGEEGFWFFKQEEEGSMSHIPRSRSSSPLQGGSLPKSLTEPLLSSQGKEKTTHREGGRA